MVSDVTVGTAVEQQSKTSAASTQLAEDFNQFLQLLTTQLQNQDPLSPMDAKEFTNQLVAFTGVEQQINTNQKLDSLVSLQLGNIMGNALGYVGMDINYVSSEFNYDGEDNVNIKYALKGEAADAKIRILNEIGDVVYEANAQTGPGQHDFVWDGSLSGGGTAPEGTYSIQIDALDADEKPVESTTVVQGRVRGVETQDGVVYLLVGDRAVSLANVLNVSQPQPAEAPGEGQA